MTQMLRQEFQLWCAGAVIANDGLQDRVRLGEFFPETVAVDGVANGWAAFVAGVAVLHVFRGEGEVVEACLGCDLDAAVSGCAEDWYAF